MRYDTSLGCGARCGWFVPEAMWDCAHPTIDKTPLVLPHQTHTVNIGLVTTANDSLSETDALITCNQNIAVGVRTADCVPIVISAPDIGAVAAVHAGWRGTIGGIVAKTIEQLISMGADATLIRAMIGPCICAECYEVDTALAQQFIDAGYGEFVVAPPQYDLLGKEPMNQSRPHLDLVAINSSQMTERAVIADNIITPNQCTRHSPLSLPSWRRHPGEPQRLITWILLSRL